MKVLDTTKNFLSISEKYSLYENSRVVIVLAPYEHTVSYGGGTKNAPKEILAASAYVEFYDDEFDRELCFDIGIATLRPLKFGKQYGIAALEMIYEQVYKALSNGKFVVTLGGEHSISTAPIKAHFDKYPSMSILHFDAHSDLREEYEGSKYSHASFMARVTEFFPAEQITQVGIRAQCREEAEVIKTKNIKTFYASAIRRGLHGTNWQENVVNTLGDDVYITFDVDYFDPAIMPATGTPEPDGFLYSETLDVFRKLRAAGKNIIGFDVVELAPLNGLSHPNLTTARLVYKMLNFAFSGK
ncbi:MAG: agmatinase [Bacteroidetes bacterium]|nr:agmatinase [Bacteroidota bacterium]